MGPVTNKAGQILTAVNSERFISKEADPFQVAQGTESDNPYPNDKSLTRAVAAKVDSTGLLWICEKLVPADQLEGQRIPPM
ncbi:hypothetical protein ABIC28_003380 [Rhodococcus sp. PvR044]